ncbi:MAG: phospho-sugar mutase [Verrucomicrobia bacterium]|nr:phospho-sugar mutase [Verrucomicrobiota bacterium]
MLSNDTQRRVQKWLNGPIDPVSKGSILNLSTEALEDAFCRSLSFGTGGLRAPMGVGTNRLNRYTVQLATQGVANYLLSQPPLLERHWVFISYDTRHHSAQFAIEAARVLASNGIGVYLTVEFRPTPYVSFGVREKRCTLGVMITASHNPKTDNGYKIYGSDGGQVTGSLEKALSAEMEKVIDFEQIKLSPEGEPLIQIVDREFDEEYLDAIGALRIGKQQVGDQLKITYTPLHGVAFKLLPKALLRWGFSNINPVDHQLLPDADFPTVTTPNPENRQTLKMGLEQLQNTASDLLIATDPDADRVAVAVMHQGQPVVLSGNQIGAICLEYLCSLAPPPKSAAVTTIVSSDLLSAICGQYKIECFRVLTGFKYIGELMYQWEKDKRHHFLFGAEESYGFLYGTYCHDKDALIASCLVCHIALELKIVGKTLLDYLREIYQKYGLYWEGQRVIEMKQDEIKQIMKKLENELPKKFEGKFITYPANLLYFALENRSKIVIRPSGTEPKLKIYVGIYEPQFTTMDVGEERTKRILDEVEALF